MRLTFTEVHLFFFSLEQLVISAKVLLHPYWIISSARVSIVFVAVFRLIYTLLLGRSAERRTDPAFEPSLYQGQLPPSGNAIFQGRDKDLKTVPAIQSADCRDKMRAQIAANSGRFALNWEISVCAGLRGGPGRPHTSKHVQ